MKIKTKLLLTFFTITIVPIALIYVSVRGLSSYQERVFSETYGITEQIDLMSGASIRLFNHLTEAIQRTIETEIQREPEVFDDPEYLGKLNEKLRDNYSFLIVRKDGETIFTGDASAGEELQEDIADYETLGEMESWGNYLDGDTEHLIKQREFRLDDGSQMGIYLITNVVDVIPEVQSMMSEIFLSSAIILFITGGILTVWVYRSILWPIGKLQEATKQIRDGNLDFTLDVEDDDEIGQLCQDFEEMRIRLKESTEEKIQYDKESKELISNISHDL